MGNTRGKRAYRAALVLSIAALACALALLGAIWASYEQGRSEYDAVAAAAHSSTAEALEYGEDEVPGSAGGIDWDALRAINPDVVAWLWIPGTNIDYPVVQGRDDSYYLTHDFAGNRGWLAQYGALFLESQNDPSFGDMANFVFGHHMNDGSMMAAVAGMAAQSRFDQSRDVYLETPSESYHLRSFSLVHCAADDPMLQIGFSSADDFAAYVQDKIDRSVVQADDVPEAGDIRKAFAFCTCDNAPGDGRYALFCYVADTEQAA